MGQLEVWKPDGRSSVALGDDQVTVGRGTNNDVAVTVDAELSRVHAVIEPLGEGWCVRDVGSSNGTFVNGERIWSARPLRNADEIRAGNTRIVYQGASVGDDETITRTASTPAAV